MNDKLPIEVKKDSIFARVLKFIKSIFKKQDEDIIIEKNKNVVKKTIVFEENNLEKSRFESITKRNNKKVIEEIIQIVEDNPNILENLDISKLEIIDRYYKHKIAECKRKLKKNNVE